MVELSSSVNSLDDLNITPTEGDSPPTEGTPLSAFSMSHLSPNERLDLAEVWIMANGGHRIGSGSSNDEEFKTFHHFTPGLYIRDLFLPASSLLATKTHKTQHPFMLTRGEVLVYGSMDGPQHLIAPHFGITKVGSRRLFYAVKDSIWMTFHPTNFTSVDEIEKSIIEPHVNPLLTSGPYDPIRFRELTMEVMAAEKPGFWSDWTEEQQQLYSADNWEAFSRSRGYTEEEIAKYGNWRSLLVSGTAQGFKPLREIIDLVKQAASRNLLMDKDNEIHKSSLVHTWMKSI